jgi:peptidoglycan hydrolase-like protein with peptidoglycan-binding domain
MKKILLTIAIATFIPLAVTHAEMSTSTATTTPVLGIIETLLKQIEILKRQLGELQAENIKLKVKGGDVKLKVQLAPGSESDDVKTLQRILKSDPMIYPEGLVTGYFGSLTEKAVMRFQEKHGLKATGRVDETTFAFINEILTAVGATTAVPENILFNPDAQKVKITVTIQDGKTVYEIVRDSDALSGKDATSTDNRGDNKGSSDSDDEASRRF